MAEYHTDVDVVASLVNGHEAHVYSLREEVSLLKPFVSGPLPPVLRDLLDAKDQQIAGLMQDSQQRVTKIDDLQTEIGGQITSVASGTFFVCT